jgi:hypothetical protein
MDEEMNFFFYKNQTWDNLKKKIIGYKRVYAKKEVNPGKDNIQFKEKLVVKCYAQKERIYYNKVFSPVIKHSSNRILLAFCIV